LSTIHQTPNICDESNSDVVSNYNRYRQLRTRHYWCSRRAIKNIIAETILPTNEIDKRPYISVLVNNVPYTGLLDSGANISVLGVGSEKFLNSPGIKFHSLPSVIQTASGQPQRVFGYIVVNIQFNNRSLPMKLYIVPSLQQSLYLGIDFWNQFKIVPTVSSLDSVIIDSTPEQHILTAEEQFSLNNVIKMFPSSVRLGLGKTNLVTHEIDIGNAKPVKQRYYAVSPVIQKLLYDELDRMLALGVIEESNSSWSSPVTLVRKPNGKVRLCLDARELNKVTVKAAYPLPLIDGLLGRLDQTKFISSIDLKDAFWQIPLCPQSRDKTAFTVPGRPLYQFTVMPFGLCNAPQTMCRLMHLVIPHHLHDRIFVYLDDLLITSATFDEHITLLSEVAQRLAKANLTINVEKSKFVLRQVKYLGYLVGEGCLRSDPDKVRAIVEFPVPKTAKQIRRFLGMSGWYRRFIQNYAILATPLTNLLKKGIKINWSAEAQSSFDALKDALITAPVLAHPNFTEPFYIQCDASSTGVGSVLFQLTSDGAERPIAFLSQKLNAAQRNYSVTELECYAAVLSVKKFRAYIEGYEFTIITDHASLQWLMSQKELSGRLARWSLKLQAFNFRIRHKKGSQNVVADAMSRVFADEICTMSQSDSDIPLHLDLNSPHFNDIDYQSRIQLLEKSPKTQSNLRSVDGKLYYTPEFGIARLDTDLPHYKLFVPSPLVLDLIKQAHVPPTSAHLGVAKTLERLKRYYYWPKMSQTVYNFVTSCESCKQNKPANQILRPPMGAQFEAVRPFQRIYADFIGPFPRTKAGNTFILIILDSYSRFVLVQAFRQATATSLCEFLEKRVFNVFSTPETLLTDNGRQFESKCLQELLIKYGVKHIKTPKYSPQSNASERVNRSIICAIRAYIKESHKEWDLHLQEVVSALRNVVHSSTKYSPHYLVFGQHQIVHGSEYELLRKLNCLSDTDVIVNKTDRLTLAQSSVLKHLRSAYERNQSHYNLRSRVRVLNVGQQVLVRNFVQSSAADSFASKLAPKFVKAQIKKLVGSAAVEVEDLRGRSMGVYHIKDVRT